MPEYRFATIDELGTGPGFHKVRGPLGIDAFGANVLVMPPRFDGFEHYHDSQDELYFVHRGRIRVDVGGESRELGEGGLFHAAATERRRISSIGDEDAIVFIVGGKGGYVERDGHLVDPETDLPKRQGLG